MIISKRTEFNVKPFIVPQYSIFVQVFNHLASYDNLNYLTIQNFFFHL